MYKKTNTVSVQQILVSHEKRIKELEKIIQELKNPPLQIGNTIIPPISQNNTHNNIL